MIGVLEGNETRITDVRLVHEGFGGKSAIHLLGQVEFRGIEHFFAL